MGLTSLMVSDSAPSKSEPTIVLVVEGVGEGGGGGADEGSTLPCLVGGEGALDLISLATCSANRKGYSY